jgi:hypothetical protein
MGVFFSVFEDKATFATGYRTSSNVSSVNERITVTNHYLRTHVSHAIGLVLGEEKRTALSLIYDPLRKLSQTPACIIREMKQVVLYSDIHLTAEDMGNKMH